MRSSVDDNESFNKAAESLCFYNPPSAVIPTRNTLERVPLEVVIVSMQPKRGLGVRINVLIIPYAGISSCNVNN